MLGIFTYIFAYQEASEKRVSGGDFSLNNKKKQKGRRHFSFSLICSFISKKKIYNTPPVKYEKKIFV